ncbi:MAG: GNAT family N-acetyltransferase [Sphingomonas sp.]
MTIIRHAIFPEDAPSVLDIWSEYIASASVSLDYQGYRAEFANLPGKYALPDGRLLLADTGGEIDACVALRKVSAEICEMKRLYVRPRARGRRLGHRLVERLIDEARTAGYSEMRLDVLEEFAQARELYRSLGFTPADPVSFNPVPGTSFLGLRLR